MKTKVLLFQKLHFLTESLVYLPFIFIQVFERHCMLNLIVFSFKRVYNSQIDRDENKSYLTGTIGSHIFTIDNVLSLKNIEEFVQVREAI